MYPSKVTWIHKLFLLLKKLFENILVGLSKEGKKARGHIFNVGHGLLPHLNPDALNWAIDEIRKS